MMPCCVRLTARDFRDLRRDVAGAKPAVDDADAALFGQHHAIAARVMVSMLADTIGRFSVRCSVNAAHRSIDDWIAARRRRRAAV